MTGTRRYAFAAVFIAVAVLLLALAPRAAAGTYRAVQCHERFGAGHADVAFARNSHRYRPSADCDGTGLGITHEPRRERTAKGRFAAWTLTAPAGTTIVRAAARVSAAASAGHAPRALLALAGGATRTLGNVRGRRRALRWSGDGGRKLSARLECARAGGCGAGHEAHLHLRRVMLALRDSAAPTLDAAGSLLGAGSRRGLQSLRVDAADAGAGVRTVTVELNGDPLASRVFDCRLAGPVALRLRPCPETAAARFDLATTAPRFRQGPNRVRICAADYAPNLNANRTCVARTVRIDNDCPISESEAAALRAHFASGRSAVGARSDSSAAVAGSLETTSGTPVAGAHVCVAARIRVDGAPERVLRTAVTDADGRFRARIPAGPSREVRVAHWPDSDRALERHLSLTARAIPRLRLRPDRELRNGESARFRVALPGPANARRHVAILARSDGSWIRIAGGRTNAAGVWRGAYRFRATTGTRRYAFRAIVRRQPGYPYRGGRSRVARVAVAGD